MGLYRKKPLVVEAEQLTKIRIIKTLEGDMVGKVGDWLITGVKGEQYPCKPDVFEMTYEPAVSEVVGGCDDCREGHHHRCLTDGRCGCGGEP